MEKNLKKRVNITMDAETEAKIKELAKEAHTSVSQWITDRVWEQAKKNKQ